MNDNNRRWHWIALIWIGAILFFTNLGATRLWDVDEAVFSQAAVEMYERNDWVTPYFNGELFAHKPPFMFWCQILAYQVFGTTEFAARLFSALFGIGCLLVTYELGRALFNNRVGLWAGIALGSCVNFTVIARAATPDVYLTFFCTLALLVLVKGTKRENATTLGSQPWQPSLPASWKTYAVAYGMMAMAVLVKGPLGLIIPMAVWGLFLLIEQRWQSEHDIPNTANEFSNSAISQPVWLRTIQLFSPLYFLKTVWRMRPFTAIVTLLLIAGPWYVWVGLRTNGEFLREFFLVHHLGRASTAMEHHSGPFYYYLVTTCLGTFPWCVLLGPMILHFWNALKTAALGRAAYVLLTCWATVWVGVFSLAGTKLPSYVMPAFPAIAVAFAALINHWLEQTSMASFRRWLRTAWCVTAIVGLGMLIALPLVTKQYLSGEWAPALIGLVPLCGAMVGWWFVEQGDATRSLRMLAVVAVVFCTGLLGFAVIPVDAHQNSPMFMRLVKLLSDKEPQLAAYKYAPPSLVFYGQQPIIKLETAADILPFFEQHPQDAFLITPEKNYQAIAGKLPADVAVLKQDRRFLRNGNIVLLGRPAQANMALRARLQR